MKQKILIVDDEPEILDILEVIIESEFSFEIIRAKNGNEAVESLKENQVSLIISDYSMDDGTGGHVFEYNKSHDNLPFILVSGGFLEDYKDLKDFYSINSLNFYLQKPIDEEAFIGAIKKCVIEDDSFLHFKEYKRLKIDHVLTFLKTNKDIYINIKGKKFLKIIHEGELFEKDQLIKYRDKGEEYVYFLNADFDDFVKEVLVKLNKSILRTHSLSDTITLGAIGYEFVHSSLRDMGLTDNHVNFVNSLVEKSVSNLMGSKSMNMMLESFFSEKGYLVSHSMTAIYVSYLICQRVEYANEASAEKLIFAAIMHDLSFKDSSLSEVMKKDSDKFRDLGWKEQKEVLNHMFDSVKLLEHFNFIPNDVENIILEHHENAKGTGFPRGISGNRISPLSAIFILSLKVAHFLYFNKLSNSGEEFMKELEIDYNNGNFKKPLKGLLACLEKALKSS